MAFQPIILLAFGFSNLAILGWLAAAAVPLLIHLWSRHRYREVPWAAIEFLRAALRKNARRTQLQQWLLLAVRTLLIVAVVAALAEPFWEQTAAEIGSGVPTHRVIVLDCSFSMGYRAAGDTLFARARQLAIQRIKASGPSDGFSVITMGAPSETIVRGPSLDREAAIKAVAGLNVGEGGGSLTTSLEMVRELVDRASSGRALFARHEIFFFTDLGLTSWQAATVGTAEDTVVPARRLIEQVEESASIFVIDVSAPDAENLAVVDFASASPLATTLAEVSFRGRVANFGPHAKEDVNVQLLVDGRPLAEQTVDIPANAEAIVQFSQRFNTPGDHAVTIQLAEDRLKVDNLRHLVTTVREQIRVLCVAGKQDAAIYVARALDPDHNDPATTSPLLATVIADGQLRDTSLDHYDCVVLCNVAQITADEVVLLRQHLRRGGGLIVFLGDRVMADQYNQLLATDDASGIIPAKLLETTNVTSSGIDPLDYRHPIVQLFRGRERSGLLTTPVFRYFRLQIPDSQPITETVIALANGDPLVVAASVERGRSLLVATAGSLASIDAATGQPWSSMAVWPSFLPIIREMLNDAVAGNEIVAVSQVGTPLSGSLSGLLHESIQMVRPDQRRDTIDATGHGVDRSWVYESTDVSGIYQLDASAAFRRLFAVNVDPAESDLLQVDVDLLPPQLAIERGTDADQVVGIPRGPLARQFAQKGSLAGNLLMMAFGLALLEVGLAWAMGGGRR